MTNFIKIFFFLGVSVVGFSQTQTTVFTPNGSAVSDTYIIPEFSSSQITAANNYVETNYPNATRLTDASATYNCHGYAWHISEGGNNVWIGYYTVTAEDIYWTDGSYVEVCSQIFPAKVSYASDNHSAITTNQTDIFKSKWGQLPVMQHNKNYTPYNSSVLKYYGSISGPNLICATGQFNSGTISGITWSSSNSSGLSINSSTGFATRQNNFNGQVTITATLGGACGNVNITRTVWVGIPDASNSTLIYPGGYRGADPVTLCSGCTYNFQVDFVAGATSYTWVLPSGFAFISGRNTATPGIRTSSASGTYMLYCRVNNQCGSSWTRSLTINIGGGGGQQQRIAVYPNPTSTSLTIESTTTDLTFSETESNDKLKAQMNEEYFTAKLLDQFNIELRGGQSNNGRITFDIQNLQDGLYYLHVQNGQELITKQIQIKK